MLIPCTTNNDYDLKTCPYCNHDLGSILTRKKKCPSCCQPIYIKYTPDDRVKRLMTELQAKHAEEQWDLYYLRQETISSLSPCGFGESHIEKERTRGARSDSEAAFDILTRYVQTKAEPHLLKIAYLTLSGYAEKEGRPFLNFVLAAHHCDLHRFKSSGLKKVRIVIAGDGNTCAECQDNSAKTYDIDDAIKSMPIPNRRCIHVVKGTRTKRCRCYYSPVLE